jgi:AcrR family transcriptional regulator
MQGKTAARQAISKPTARRRERERDARRRLILDTAQKVFAERGFFNATVEEIAARAELAVGTLYRYFKSKEEMYVSLLFEAMEMFHQQIQSARESGAPPDAQLRAVWNYFLQFYREQPEYYRAFIFLHNDGLREMISPEVMQEINRRAGENFRALAKIVRAGMDAGVYDADLDARGVADILWALWMGLVQLIETRRNMGVPADMLEKLHRRALEWIECGLKK